MKSVKIGTVSSKASLNENFGDINDNFKELCLWFRGSSRMITPLETPQELTLPTYDGSGQVIHPSVLYFPDKFGGVYYWMAMTPYPDNDNTKENPSILQSQDGVTWQVPAGVTNPLDIPETGYYSDTSLVYAVNKLYIYWANHATSKTYRVSSTDGTTWTPKEEVTYLQGADVKYLGVLNGVSTWIAWNKTVGGQMSRHVSNDGIGFSKALPVSTNLNGEINHISVLPDGNGYHFLAGCAAPNGRGGSALYYGFSDTGTSVLFDINPVLQPTQDTFYASILYTTCMVRLGNNEYELYISAKSGFVVRTGRMRVKLNEIVVPVVQTGSKAMLTKRVLLFKEQEIRSATQVYSPFLQSGIIPNFNDYPNKSITFYNTHDKSINLIFSSDFYGFSLSTWTGKDTKTRQMVTIAPGLNLFQVNFLHPDDLAILRTMISGYIKAGLAATDAGDLPTQGNITIEITMWA